MRLKWLLQVAVGVMLVGAATASADVADTITMQFQGDTPARSATLTLPVYPPNTGANTVFYIGRSVFHVIDDGEGAAVTQLISDAAETIHDTKHLYAWCIDTQQFVPYSSQTWDVTNINTLNDVDTDGEFDALPSTVPQVFAVDGVRKRADLQALFAHYMDPLANTSNDYAAAMAATVWEIITEPTQAYDLTAGAFAVLTPDPDISAWGTLAQGWLDAIALNPSVFELPQIYTLYNSTYQDFTIAVGGVGVNPVPEPFTMLTAFMAIGSFGMYMRKHTRKGLAGAPS